MYHVEMTRTNSFHVTLSLWVLSLTLCGLSVLFLFLSSAHSSVSSACLSSCRRPYSSVLQRSSVLSVSARLKPLGWSPSSQIRAARQNPACEEPFLNCGVHSVNQTQTDRKTQRSGDISQNENETLRLNIQSETELSCHGWFTLHSRCSFYHFMNVLFELQEYTNYN